MRLRKLIKFIRYRLAITVVRSKDLLKYGENKCLPDCNNMLQAGLHYGKLEYILNYTVDLSWKATCVRALGKLEIPNRLLK